MACDFQKTTYRRARPRTSAQRRTTYGQMNQWLDYTPDDLVNPYISAAARGRFRPMTPVLDFPAAEKRRASWANTAQSPTHYKSFHRHEPPRRQPATRNSACQAGSFRQGDPDRSESEGYYFKRLSPEAKTYLGQAGYIPLGNGRILAQGAPIHLQYAKSGGYDDFHRSFLQVGKLNISPTYPLFGPPRLRHGGHGGSWRHVKEVMQPGGRRIVFVDGGVRTDDNNRIHRVPAGNMMQPLAPDGVLVGNTPRKGHSKRIAQEDALNAFKGTEKANWYIVR